MLVDEAAGHDRVGRVGADRGERAAEFGGQVGERGRVPGDAGHLGARLAQRHGGGPAEAAAGAGHDGSAGR